MSVIVKGMDVPKRCCNGCIAEEHCRNLNECLIIELPEKHGRLIDADEVIKIVTEHSYLLRDVNSIVDFGMYNEGIIQAVNECVTIMENEGNNE